MGWTFFHRNSSETIAETLKREVFSGPQCVLLDCAVVKRTTAYCAVQFTAKNGATYVFCAVILLQYARDHYNFGYKDMTEFMGPCESECPQRILDALTPLEQIKAADGTDIEFATAWRARCVAFRAKPVPKPGQFIVFAEPIPFVNGAKLTTFAVVRTGKSGVRFESGGIRYRISGWQGREYTVQAAQA